jgi:hypothetical protein
MADGAFCGNCGVAVAVDDRFCGECGAPQELDATPRDKEGSLPADHPENVQGTTGADRPTTSAEPVTGLGRPAKKSSLGFWDMAGITVELFVRGVYVVICGGIAVLALQHGSILIGLGAIAYGLYILAGGRWFIY